MSNNQGGSMFKVGDQVHFFRGSGHEDTATLQKRIGETDYYKVTDNDRVGGVDVGLCFSSWKSLVHARKLKAAANSALRARASSLRMEADALDLEADRLGDEAMRLAPR